MGRMRVMYETCCSNHGIFCVTWGGGEENGDDVVGSSFCLVGLGRGMGEDTFIGELRCVSSSLCVHLPLYGHVY